jgi:hypothetical protein
VATAILLFGAKKQLALFPEKIDAVVELCRGLDERIEEESESEGEKRRGGRGERNSGVEGVMDDRCVAVGTRKGSKHPLGIRKKNTEPKKEVGGVLGSLLGYESSADDDDDSDESTSNSNHSDNNDQQRSEDRPTQSSNSNHQPHPLSGNMADLVEQVNTNFENWCERMGDGSLRRCGVEEWPEWG